MNVAKIIVKTTMMVIAHHEVEFGSAYVDLNEKPEGFKEKNRKAPAIEIKVL